MAELRRHIRHPFPALQRIAPRDGAELPRERDFFRVRFYDLSEAGASFLLAGPPSFKRLVLALVASSEDTTYFGAEVVHVTPVRVSWSGALERIDNEESPAKQQCSLENRGRRMFLVGCRVTERLGTFPTKKLWSPERP
jgi:hypothetical protein